VTEDGRRVDNGGAGLTHPEAVEGNSGLGKKRAKGKGLSGGEVGLL